jgi:alanine-glyoxylate transaminase/serine-glyoxylate transaminase/serine-pyruvate transaminase
VNSRLLPRIMAPTSRASPNDRLTQITKHLDSKPFLELNTPFSTERSSRFEDERGNTIKRHTPPATKAEQPVQKQVPAAPKKMSQQKPHPALLIPGPIEFDDAVLESMSHYRYICTPNGTQRAA